MSPHPLTPRTLWSALCMAILSWTLPASAEADSWNVSADELGTISKMELSDTLPNGKSRQVELTVSAALAPTSTKVTVDGKTRAASQRERQYFWRDRGGAIAAWKHYLSSNRLTLALVGTPRDEGATLSRKEKALVPRKGKLPGKLVGKVALVTLFNDTAFVGVVGEGLTDTDMILQIDDKKVTFLVTAIKSVHLISE